MKIRAALFLLTAAFLAPVASMEAKAYVNPECTPCPPADPCAKCAQIWPDHGPNWIITPHGGPCVACGFDAHITAEFIYWTGREEHLGFAYKETFDTVDSRQTVASKGSIYEPDWNFRPGFRVGVGVLRNHDGWDVYANYTWLVIRNTKNTVRKGKPNEQIIPIGTFTFAGASPDLVTSSSGKWTLDFNVVDLELGRNFFISRYLTLRPHFGLKGTWQKQSFDVSTFSDTSAKLPWDQYLSDNSLDYWGIGICAGLDTAWHLNRCSSVVAEVATCAMWERFTVDAKATRTSSTNAAPNVAVLNVEKSFHTIKPVLELFLGARWETWFCCDNFHFSIEGGWEQQWWGDQNQFFDSATQSRLGDLVLQGFTMKLRLDF